LLVLGRIVRFLSFELGGFGVPLIIVIHNVKNIGWDFLVSSKALCRDGAATSSLKEPWDGTWVEKAA
jgi:hypothetical protein